MYEKAQGCRELQALKCDLNRHDESSDSLLQMYRYETKGTGQDVESLCFSWQLSDRMNE